MTDTKNIPLRIEPISGGGFVVSDAWHNDQGRLCGPLFACSSLGEALDFIRSRLAPPVTGAAIGGTASTAIGGANKRTEVCDNCRKSGLVVCVPCGVGA
jgi:hypothetical protein